MMNAIIRKIKKTTIWVAAAGFLALLTAGCELDDDSTNSVTIYPTSATLKADETNIVEFTADGGNRSYTWSMNNNLLGALYVATTNTAIALYQNTTNIGTNIITARDTGGGAASARIMQK